jgi:hypothetical protein
MSSPERGCAISPLLGVLGSNKGAGPMQANLTVGLAHVIALTVLGMIVAFV